MPVFHFQALRRHLSITLRGRGLRRQETLVAFFLSAEKLFRKDPPVSTSGRNDRSGKAPNPPLIDFLTRNRKWLIPSFLCWFHRHVFPQQTGGKNPQKNHNTCRY